MDINCYSFKMVDRELFKNVNDIIPAYVPRSTYHVGNTDMLIIFNDKKDFNTILTILSRKYPKSLYSIYDTNCLKITN